MAVNSHREGPCDILGGTARTTLALLKGCACRRSVGEEKNWIFLLYQLLIMIGPEPEWVTYLKSKAPYSDPTSTLCLRPFFPFFRPNISVSCSPASLTTPPIHSIRLLAKDNISFAVRLTTQRGYDQPALPRCRFDVCLKDQCWSRSTSSSRRRGDGSVGMSTERDDSNVDVMTSGLSAWDFSSRKKKGLTYRV